MSRLGLGLGLFKRLRNLLMGIAPDTGDQYSSHIYDAGDYTGRVLFRTFDNDPAAPTFKKNTVGWFGVNIDNNTNPISPSIPALAIAIEGSYYSPPPPDGIDQEQQEIHIDCFYNGIKKRPLSFWHNLASARDSNLTFRGTIGIHDDADSPYVRFSASARRLQLYPAVQIATTDGSRVIARGLEVRDGTLQITAYTVDELTNVSNPGYKSPSPSGQTCIVTDDVGGRTMATSDSSNWRRVSDGAVVSTI